jgi:hypothetical protein
VLTDTRFWLGVGAGVAIAYFVIPWVRGAMATRQTR